MTMLVQKRGAFMSLAATLSLSADVIRENGDDDVAAAVNMAASGLYELGMRHPPEDGWYAWYAVQAGLNALIAGDIARAEAMLSNAEQTPGDIGWVKLALSAAIDRLEEAKIDLPDDGREQRLVFLARDNPHFERTKAARRLCAKYGYSWDT